MSSFTGRCPPVDSDTLFWAALFSSLPRLPFRARRTKENALAHSQSPSARDRSVDSRVVLVDADDGLHQLWRQAGCFGIDIQHRATFVPHGDGNGGSIVSVAELQ